MTYSITTAAAFQSDFAHFEAARDHALMTEDVLDYEDQTLVREQDVETVSAQDWADFQAVLDWEAFEGFGQ